MGKSTRKRQEEKAARDLEFTQLLTDRGADSGKSYRGVISANAILTSTMRSLEHFCVRSPQDWKYTGKSNKIEKQRLELLRHMYGIYPVPRFLERGVINDDTAYEQFHEQEHRRVGDELQHEFMEWYVAAAQGKSLYKTCTCVVMSKKETHMFLHAPDELDIRQAVWWAKGMMISNDIGIAYRLARSVISIRGTYEDDFWIDVHRFFANNPVTMKEMTELVDYILSERRENKQWTIKKRSLEAIRRKSEEWHRAQSKMRHIGGGSWGGMGIEDWTCVTGKAHPDPKKNKRIEWNIRQILTGNDLAREGQRMRHCVSSYKRECMGGSTAIFSMTSNTPIEINRRNLTIEVTCGTRCISQVRGYANRMPRSQERAILRLWASKRNLRINTWT